MKIRRIETKLAQVLLVSATFVAAAIPNGFAQDSYVIGMTGDLSGPTSGNYKPWADGVRVYFDHVNAAGGIGGRKINLLTRDNRADPNQTVADLNYFADQKALAVTLVAPSNTLGPYLRANASQKLPTIYVNECYPPATPPKADPTFFCPGISTLTVSFVVVDQIFELMAGAPVQLGIIASDIPGARGAAERIMKPYAEKKGAKSVEVAVVPLGTTDLTPHARKFMDSGVNAVISYTPAHHMLAGMDALHRLEWKGKYLLTSFVPGVFPHFARLKWDNLYGLDYFALADESKPVMRDLLAAAKSHRYDFPVEDLRFGWRSAMALTKSLEACGWPCDRDKLLSKMSMLNINDAEMLDLQGSPITWSTTNHTSPNKAFRVYRWDSGANRVVVAKDWFKVDERDWEMAR